tara:strand:+ start:81 stop:1115 length:1035 start_codon:yes stop_codon:yes gene_type:complete
MAFKLKSSPFNANVTTVKPTIQSSKLIGDSGNRLTSEGNSFMVPTAEADMEVNTQTPTNKTTEKLTKKADEGIPLGLNPKQEARFKTKKYKKGLRDDAKFDRQTRKAENIYERNQFEALQNLDEKGDIITEGKKGAGTTYYSPDAAEKEKTTRSDASQDRLEKATLGAGAATTAANEKSRLISKNIKNYSLNDNLNIDGSKKLSLNMEGNIKPNRAGTPVRMLKSMEDTTPMKYKSVRKAGRENLMSALAKQGEPIDVKEVIKKVAYNMVGGPAIDAISRTFEDKKEPVKKPVNTSFKTTPETNFKSTKPGTSNQPNRVTVGDRAKQSIKKAVKVGLTAGGLKL